ncbi:MAG: hybrid sensor histidine kinase/response regulator [Chloroflexota bacterium]
MLSGCNRSLANLISNAQKYTPAGGRIRVSARALGGAVEVCVEDEGLGIPADALPKVFDKFYRVQSSDGRDIKGTGLGLAIVKQIVETLGGEVGVASGGPGTGSRFCFTLPLTTPIALDEDRSSRLRDAVATGGGAQGFRVLAVDDDPTTGSALTRLLRRDGHHVVAVTSGEEAVRGLTAEPFDTVISDLDLGSGMNGWELAARVRSTWPHVRFVLSSGSIAINASEAYKRGVDAPLPKPYAPEELRLLLAGYSLSKAEAAAA